MSNPRPNDGTIVGIGAETPPADEQGLRETAGWVQQRKASQSLVGQTIGSYRITRLLGEGGVGAVYLGEHPLIGSRVAIKVLHDDFADSVEMVNRFVQEAKAANAISSAHIVRVTDFGKLADGRDYAVMECLEGQPLDAALAAEGPLSIDRVVELTHQIAEAMVAAHAVGVIHRDLKPENIFLETTTEEKEFVRILDFGIAKLTDVNETNVRRTAAGFVLGTPVYCAPEQATGQHVGPQADIYALGAVAYELLTGRPVFGGNVVEILVSKSTREASPLMRADVPAALEALILQMLARDPASRPASMRDVLLRLRPMRNDALEPSAQRASLAASKGTKVLPALPLASAANPAPQEPTPTANPRIETSLGSVLPIISRQTERADGGMTQPRRRWPLLAALATGAVLVVGLLLRSRGGPSVPPSSEAIPTVAAAPTPTASAPELAVAPPPVAGEPAPAPSTTAAQASEKSKPRKVGPTQPVSKPAPTALSAAKKARLTDPFQ